MKLNMEKAYDHLEWDYINKTIITMGFPMRLVNTIMQCVTIVSYSNLINDSPSKDSHPSRGIRQGDPMSPYLLILCAEVLSGIILKSQERGTIHRLTMAMKDPTINHLFLLMTVSYFKGLKRKRLRKLIKKLYIPKCLMPYNQLPQVPDTI